MEKIRMVTPLVEMDGDEMTRVLWGMIKEELLLPFVDLKTEYYDLGLLHRNETRDQVTVDAACATQRLGVAVKCASVPPFCWTPFTRWSKIGRSPSPLPVMPMATCIRVWICIPQSLVPAP